jgi:ArsR family transcriptional regulator
LVPSLEKAIFVKKETLMTTSNLLPEQAKIERAADILRALAHPLRLRILAFIDEQESAMVHEIYQTLGIEQSITSQHLRILRDANLVEHHREGKFIRYRLHYPVFLRIQEELEQLLS